MSEEETDAQHKRFAIEAFNRTWDLIDKADRTAAEDDMMVHSAHASRFHWGQIGTPTALERGDWQISRVYALLGRGEEALHYARRCLDTCLENEIADFDLAFAYEAMARAHAVLGDADRSSEYVAKAERAAEVIAEDEKREYLLSELGTVPKL
jgi:tetratricopeptide (TPR) repeat protein